MKKVCRLLPFLLLFYCLPSYAALEYNARLSEAHQHIIRLEFEAGSGLLLEEKKQNPSNNLVLLYENYIDFLKAFIAEEPVLFNQFKKNFAARARIIESEKQETPWKHFSLAEMKLQDALLKIKFREFLSASIGIRSAYKLLEKNTAAYPDFLLNKKCLGLIHVAVGSVPAEHRWLVELAGMKGTVPQGLEEILVALKMAPLNFPAYHEEILFYLSTIQCSLSFTPEELNRTAELVKPFSSQSALMKYCYINLCIRAGNSSKALDLVKEEVQGDHFPFYFLNYKMGMLMLYKLDFGSERYFNLYLEKYKGMNFIKAAYQKIAWIHFLKGDNEKYLYYMDLAAKNGSLFTDEDKQTNVEARARALPNMLLLRSRLLYDGGYYSQALAEFKNSSLRSFPRYKDQLEMTYRLARIYQSLGQNDKAIHLYGQTLRNGEKTTYYFPANSALLLGNIYENSGQRDSAIYYYKKCLDLRHHEYQNSIDQKAQTGLEKLGVDY